MLKFPEKLMNVLDGGQYNDCIRWSLDGLSFEIIDPVHMEKKLLKEAFNGEKIHSFIRKIYKWGFVARPSGSMVVWKSFSCNTFQRGNRKLCRAMKRGEKSSRYSLYPSRPTFQSQESNGSVCSTSTSDSSSTFSSMSTSASTTSSSITGTITLGNATNRSGSYLIGVESVHLYYGSNSYYHYAAACDM